MAAGRVDWLWFGYPLPYIRLDCSLRPLPCAPETKIVNYILNY